MPWCLVVAVYATDMWLECDETCPIDQDNGCALPDVEGGRCILRVVG